MEASYIGYSKIITEPLYSEASREYFHILSCNHWLLNRSPLVRGTTIKCISCDRDSHFLNERAYEKFGEKLKEIKEKSDISELNRLINEFAEAITMSARSKDPETIQHYNNKAEIRKSGIQNLFYIHSVQKKPVLAS